MKTVIEMAREAGIDWHRHWNDDESNMLEQFAELVRADERDRAMRENAYVLAEREACAKLCDDKHDTWRFGDGEDSTSGPKDCAAAIRKRGAGMVNLITHCRCDACKNGNIHDSDCAVHNMPAYPNGPCDCRLAAFTQPNPQSDERNFCHRCGKRLMAGGIHTCTPPQPINWVDHEPT